MGDISKKQRKSLCNRLKEKIIHKFGGYTREEYDKINEIARMPLPTVHKTVRYETLAVAFTWDKYHMGQADDVLIEYTLIEEIARALHGRYKDFVNFETREDNAERKTVRATLCIVNPNSESYTAVYGRDDW